MKIFYIAHSSFLVETSGCSMLFDYYRGEIPSVDPGKPLYVFASHFHQDHFSKKIFDLADEYPCVIFILASDIPQHFRIPESLKTAVMDPRTTWSDERIRVETLRSNDSGTAFIISVPDNNKIRMLYHAGDLNNWHWDEEPDSLALIEEYHAEMETIRGRHFDAAFIPLDPRLENHAQDGILDFGKYADADRIYPMHMWEDCGVIERFLALPEAEPYREKTAAQSFYTDQIPEYI